MKFKFVSNTFHICSCTLCKLLFQRSITNLHRNTFFFILLQKNSFNKQRRQKHFKRRAAIVNIFSFAGKTLAHSILAFYAAAVSETLMSVKKEFSGKTSFTCIGAPNML